MKHIFLLSVLLFYFNISFTQSPPVAGSSTNLCPFTSTFFTYTSATGCDASGWFCSGCSTNSTIDGGNQVKTTGTNSDGTVWAKVQWDNVSTGFVENVCGRLNVTIQSIEVPSISSNINALCGSGSIIFTATVLSTTNITGYSWTTIGSGLSLDNSGTTTTGNTLTLTYSNWTPSNSSVQVGVGSRNSACGFVTEIRPLSSTIMTVVAGNTNNIPNSFTFSPTTLCSNPTMQVTNQPSGTSINWSSSNSSALNFTNASTGAASIVNNYNGGVSVTATISTACGSKTQSKDIWIGLPFLTGLTDNGNSFLPSTVCAGSTDQFQTYLDAAYPTGVYSNIAWTGSNVSISSYGAPTASVYYNGTIGSYASVGATVTNLCGTWSGNATWIGQIVDCGGGGDQNSEIYPNPSDKYVTIKTQSFSRSESTVSISIVNEQDSDWWN